MSLDGMLNNVRDAITGAGYTCYRHLAPQGSARPYVILTPLNGPIFRTFVAAQTFQQYILRVTLWWDYDQDDSAILTASEAIQTALDMQAMGGTLFRLAETPALLVVDADQGRRVFQITQNYIYEETRA